MRYKEIKKALGEATLMEVPMNPTSLQKFAGSPDATGLLMGFEFEMYVPNLIGTDSNVYELDSSEDKQVNSIVDIEEFFDDTITRPQREELEHDFLDWEEERRREDIDTDDLDSRIRRLLEKDYDYSDALDRAAKELDADRKTAKLNDIVRERADEIKEKDIQSMIDRQSSDYNRSYNDAMEEMLDEMRSAYSYGEHDWLVSLGVERMTDAAAEFGFEWPTQTMSEVSDSNLREVASDFEHALGITVNFSNEYHGAPRNPGQWAIETDSSLTSPRDNDDGGLEFISPPMPVTAALTAINAVKKWASDHGCYTNESTGFHINISIPEYSIEKLDYIKLALFMGDRYVLEQFGRISNTYTKSAVSVILSYANTSNVQSLMQQMRENLNTAASKLIHKGVTTKMTSINTKNGYVEFRGPGGNYLDKPVNQLVNTALRLALALHIACDENAYKREYATKLYKLISPVETGNGTVGIFSRFAAGELTKEELVTYLKQTKQNRDDKQLPQNTSQYWLVYITHHPESKQTVIARNTLSAIKQAQLQIPEWDGWSDDQFTVQPTGKIATEPQVQQPHANTAQLEVP